MVLCAYNGTQQAVEHIFEAGIRGGAWVTKETLKETVMREIIVCRWQKNECDWARIKPITLKAPLTIK